MVTIGCSHTGSLFGSVTTLSGAPGHAPVQLYPTKIILSKQLLSKTFAQGTSVESRVVLLETVLSITALHAFKLVFFQDVARLALLEGKHAVCFMSETVI